MKDKALKAIEVLTVLECRPDDDLVGQIYMYSHIANGRCKNPHSDWVTQLDEVYAALVQAGEIREDE